MEPLSRADFGSRARQREFFREAKTTFGDWRNFYYTLGGGEDARFTFRQFKRWHLGQALPTLDSVALICKFTGQDPRELRLKVRDSNWGRRQGGTVKVENYGCNLTLPDRIKGGETTGGSHSISYLRAIASVGGSNSVKSGQNPRRVVPGPGGIRMFNDLERDVMMRIIRAALEVVYEPILKVGTRRLIPDFRVGSTYIECTRDTHVSVKARRLGEKFRLLREHFHPVKCLLVTLPRLLARYRYYLEPRVEVAMVRDFLGRIPEFLDGPGRI